MTKICHISSLHRADDVRIFHKECCTLAAAGFDTHLLVVNQQSRLTNGVNIHSFDIPRSRRLKRMRLASKVLLKAAIELDASIYHLHDPELLPLGVKLKKHGKKVIYDAHEDVPRQILAKPWIPRIIRPFVSRRFESYENRACLKLDAVVTSTPFIRKRFAKFHPQVVDICNFPKLEELHAAIDWATKENAVCYVGRIDEVRGAKELIKMVAETDTRLELAGWFGSDSLKNELQQMPGWQQVIDNGFQGRAGVAAILGKSKAGLVTLHPLENYLEALPVKMFEYMAAGIPVIASNFPYYESILQKHNCGISVDPLKPHDIAAAVKSILKDEQNAQNMGQRGRLAVEEFYNWDIEAKKLVSLYQEIGKS